MYFVAATVRESLASTFVTVLIDKRDRPHRILSR